MLTKYDLYELCAQAPDRDVRMLQAIHGRNPKILGEDFSGGGAIAKRWAVLVPGGKAVAVDMDPEPLERLRGAPGVKVICADVRTAVDPVDLIADLNFSLGEIHTRADLVAYFRHARSRLRTHGVFIADMYGGSDSYFTGVITERKKGPDGEKIEYDWEQRHADPLTGRVVNAMHFRVSPASGSGGKAEGGGRGGEKVGSTAGGKAKRPKPIEMRDAFVYKWRLWTIPELREALIEAGFASTQVYPRFAEAIDSDGALYVSPVASPDEVGDSFSVYIVGRTDRSMAPNGRGGAKGSAVAGSKGSQAPGAKGVDKTGAQDTHSSGTKRKSHKNPNRA